MFRVMARKNRAHADVDINGVQPVMQAYGFIGKLFHALSKIELLEDETIKR